MATPAERRDATEIKGLDQQVPRGRRITDQCVTSPSSNKNDAVQAKKNPGALAGATEANSNERENSELEYRLRREWATALLFAIDHCDPTDAALIMSDALERMRGGSPIPPLLNAMEEAKNWAALATPFEVKAYCLACYEAMEPKSQAGFIAHVTGRASR